jgi:hypothetical protein
MAHGGRREGAGRKTKAEEMGLPALIEDVIGDAGKKTLVQTIFRQATGGSFKHQELLMQYIYGKPQDYVDVTTQGEKIDAVKEIIFRRYSKPDA